MGWNHDHESDRLVEMLLNYFTHDQFTNLLYVVTVGKNVYCLVHRSTQIANRLHAQAPFCNWINYNAINAGQYNPQTHSNQVLQLLLPIVNMKSRSSSQSCPIDFDESTTTTTTKTMVGGITFLALINFVEEYLRETRKQHRARKVQQNGKQCRRMLDAECRYLFVVDRNSIKGRECSKRFCARMLHVTQIEIIEKET